MYTPPAFRHDDLAELHAAIRSAGLATLVTATAEGLIGTPLPLILAADEGPFGTLYGHIARANPQATLPPVGEAMAIFAGPDAYVSPGWYPSKAEHGRVVPTWNYAAIHAYGDPRVLRRSRAAACARQRADRPPRGGPRRALGGDRRAGEVRREPAPRHHRPAPTDRAASTARPSSARTATRRIARARPPACARQATPRREPWRRGSRPEYPSWSTGDFGPFAVIADESVGEDDELSHDGGDRELGRLSGLAERSYVAFIAGLKRVATSAGM